eukprot:2066497-Heterocapsa_arctica.AAC.1
MERLHFGTHYMDSPRTKSYRNYRISAVRMTNPEIPQEKAGFKLFRRGDIRDTAGFFEQMNFMEPVKRNIYRIEGVDRNFKEHPIEVAGSTLESILGL